MAARTLIYSVSQKSPLRFYDIFPKRLAFLVQILRASLYVPIYARLRDGVLEALALASQSSLTVLVFGLESKTLNSCVLV